MESKRSDEDRYGESKEDDFYRQEKDGEVKEEYKRDIIHQEEIDSEGRVKERKMGISDGELLERVQKYFFEDDHFTKTFERFIEKESHVVDLDDEEYKLQYTEAYERFKALFEKMMEEYISQQGCSAIDFYRALRERQEADPEGSMAIFGQILVSVTDFHIFMTMMKESAAATRQKHK